MFHNYLMTALRNLARNRLYTVINVLGLTLGAAPLIFVGMLLQHELSFDDFLPQHDRLYLLTDATSNVNGAFYRFDTTPSSMPALLKANVTDIEEIARVAQAPASLRHGDREFNDTLLWSDPNIFSILALPTVAGDLDQALRNPDGLVMTESTARKYFGDEPALGQVIEIDRQHPMTVTAVIKDLPTNTNLRRDPIFAAGTASFAPFPELEKQPESQLRPQVYSFIKAITGASTSRLSDRIAEVTRPYVADLQKGEIGISHAYGPTPLTALHLADQRASAWQPSISPMLLYAGPPVAGLILLIAGINFVNLMTARAPRRALEVGVRKTAGARQRHLIVQFIGEAILHAAMGVALAVGIAKLAGPSLATLIVTTPVTLQLPHYYVALAAGFCVLLGVLAGAYPSFILSLFRPADIVKAGGARSSSRLGRRLLVAVQFSILTVLLLAAVVAFEQARFALDIKPVVNTDQVVRIRALCRDALKAELARVPGVRGVACSDARAVYSAFSLGPAVRADGQQVTVSEAVVDFDFLQLMQLKPIAGRFFEEGRARDMVPAGAAPTARSDVVLNEAAVRLFGYASPQQAISGCIRRAAAIAGSTVEDSEIIGVVPDFVFNPVENPIRPMVYYINPSAFRLILVKLDGAQFDAALAGVDRAWQRAGEPRPIDRQFEDQRLQNAYSTIARQGRVFSFFSGLAVFIACLGVFGLSAFAVEQRTKEIGVRKAMGANIGDVLRLLIWQFVQPVLWANLIAWPAAFLIARRWLESFAAHIDLTPWMFLAASATVLLIAVATVTGHALLVARAQPVTALRYE